MPASDDLTTHSERQRALRQHQERGTPQDAMDGNLDYAGASWVVVGNSIQIELDPEKCAGRQRIIVTCPDLGQACKCNLHEGGVCPGHDINTRSRVLLSSASGITGVVAICDSCQPHWRAARNQAAEAAVAARVEARASRRAARAARNQQPASAGRVGDSSGMSASDRVLAAVTASPDTGDPDQLLGELAELGVKWSPPPR